MGLTMIPRNATVSRQDSPSSSIRLRRTRMRRFASLLLAGAASLVAAVPSGLAAQGFGVYEHNTCAMGRAGVTAARPCADGSAIYFSPAGLAGLTGTHISAGVTLIGAQGSFTDDFLANQSDLKNPLIPDALRIPAGLPVGTTFAMLGVPTGTDFADATLEANGSGFAVNFGAIWQVTDRLSIGGHWLTRKQITYDGDATFKPIATGLVLPVAVGPPPAGTPVDAVLAPQFATGGPLAHRAASTAGHKPPPGPPGFAYKINDQWSFMADYQYVVWGWFNEVDINFLNAGTPDIALHPSNKDTHGFRFGTEYQYNSKVQLRGGYLHHGAASPAQFVTPLLPEAARNEFTLGAGIALTSHWHADLAYQYIRQNDRRGTINLAAGTTGLYKFSAHLFAAGVALTF